MSSSIACLVKSQSSFQIRAVHKMPASQVNDVMQARRRVFSAVALGLTTVGCSMLAPAPPPPPPPCPALPAPPPPPPAPRLSLTLIAARALNPDVRGRASPVVVRLYELRSLSVFESAHFMGLYQQDRSFLIAPREGRQERIDLFRERVPHRRYDIRVDQVELYCQVAKARE